MGHSSHFVFMNKLLLWDILIFFCLLQGCASNQRTFQTGAPELKDLGRHNFTITTSSSAAQLAFNRGLNLAYSFGHYAAEQEFRKALKADPDCAMAYWGIALVNG